MQPAPDLQQPEASITDCDSGAGHELHLLLLSPDHLWQPCVPGQILNSFDAGLEALAAWWDALAELAPPAWGLGWPYPLRCATLSMQLWSSGTGATWAWPLALTKSGSQQLSSRALDCPLGGGTGPDVVHSRFLLLSGPPVGSVEQSVIQTPTPFLTMQFEDVAACKL